MEEFNKNLIEILQEINSKLDKLLEGKQSLTENNNKRVNTLIKEDINELVHIDDQNHIHFLQEVMGDKAPEKQVNGTVIYLTLNHKYKSSDTIGSAELGEFLTKQGIPTKNLSRSLRKYKSFVIQKGTAGKSVTYTITRPGLIRGEQLLNSYKGN